MGVKMCLFKPQGNMIFDIICAIQKNHAEKMSMPFHIVLSAGYHILLPSVV